MLQALQATCRTLDTLEVFHVPCAKFSKPLHMFSNASMKVYSVKLLGAIKSLVKPG